MATDPLPASLSFLTDAAHLLAAASPQVSAHLMSQRNSLMFNNDLEQPDAQRQRVCGSCGHIMMPGQGDLLKFETRRAVRRKGKATKAEAPAKAKACQKRFTCGMCGRFTKIDLPRPNPIQRRRKAQTSSDLCLSTSTEARDVSTPPPGVAAADAAAAKPSANANSKKRAKNRKQGLQALLQQSTKAKPQGGLGLSLADFMKK
ncbi:hypothetical protein F4780DRAFT_531039 [Xylariomycetidae sp. FL0641]|nr:hypothetical protein F4780DRAFT_531039 [Xylariomycetidae sp. FL0641]